MEAIQTQALTKFYGKARGIRELSLQVEQGEFFGFIGPNGAGKSTTIRCLLGLISATSGSARVLGLDIGANRKEILTRTGYLPSEAVFYPGMRVREVLKLSADLRGKNCAREAEGLCQRLQLDTGKKVEELSFGNRKKVGIVCALQHRPELLILDEPTSGLDPLMQREFFSILQERNREGATVFLSSHILSEIQRNCTRAAIIREGRLLACGSVEELSRTNARRVTLRGSAEVQTLSGIRDCRKTEEGLSFLYSGDMQTLLSCLSGGRVEDLTIAEPDLEEVFLHYYEKEES
ncbi:MAG: ABC transporter ATP-binding protein [Candidatus Faecousia sp.]|nr:ABC transporter ATP-binding protein [Clostridiales bacterium]MDY6179663.1 ABC transporter ATP-binding protein [Candidatus Faecousia sp.]